MNNEIKKEIIHRYSDGIKEFYGGDSMNADVDSHKLLSDLIEELKLLNIPPVSNCIISEYDKSKMAKKWADDRSEGDKQQDRDCYYDYLCGMEAAIRKLNDC